MTSELYFNNIMLCCRRYKNISVNITDFNKILNKYAKHLDFLTTANILSNGVYAHLLGVKVWVSPDTLINHVRVSNFENDHWSPNFSLDDNLEKILEMKAFW